MSNFETAKDTEAGFVNLQDDVVATTVDYTQMMDELRGVFESGLTKDLAWRKQQLAQVPGLALPRPCPRRQKSEMKRRGRKKEERTNERTTRRKEGRKEGRKSCDMSIVFCTRCRVLCVHVFASSCRPHSRSHAQHVCVL